MKRLLAILAICGALDAQAHRRPQYRMRATAFYLHGIGASGLRSQPGTVAADPRFLPMGTRIRILDAGRYSGKYLVTDTGSRIHGRRIDLRLPSRSEARRFGKRVVTVEVLDSRLRTPYRRG